MIKPFLLGFFAKIVMGFDDAITHVPIMAGTTKSRNAQFLFAAGNLIALTFIIILAMFFSHLVRRIPYYRYVMAVALLVLAVLIFKGHFIHERTIRTRKLIKKLGLSQGVGALVIGFVASMFTLLDDVIAYTPILTEEYGLHVYTISGIYAAALLEILAVIFFARALQRFRYKDQLAAAGLVVIAALLVFNII